MNLDKSSGSIEEGKNADLIIADGDPYKNISDIRNVTTAIKGVHVYDPGQAAQAGLVACAMLVFNTKTSLLL